MATIDISDDALDDLSILATESEKTALRLIYRLYSWANRTPPIPSGSTRLGLSMSSVYQCICKVDNREFIITFIYPYGSRNQFMVVNVTALDDSDLDSKSTLSESNIYELDN